MTKSKSGVDKSTTYITVLGRNRSKWRTYAHNPDTGAIYHPAFGDMNVADVSFDTQDAVLWDTAKVLDHATLDTFSSAGHDSLEDAIKAMKKLKAVEKFDAQP